MPPPLQNVAPVQVPSTQEPTAAGEVKQAAPTPQKNLKTTAICLAAGTLGFALMAGLLAVPGGIFVVPLLGALAGGCLVGAIQSHGMYLGSKMPPAPDIPSRRTGQEAINAAGAHFVNTNDYHDENNN
jgi:hypothetical protein